MGGGGGVTIVKPLAEERNGYRHDRPSASLTSRLNFVCDIGLRRGPIRSSVTVCMYMYVCIRAAVRFSPIVDDYSTFIYCCVDFTPPPLPCVCVRACVRACVCACVRACVCRREDAVKVYR